MCCKPLGYGLETSYASPLFMGFASLGRYPSANLPEAWPELNLNNSTQTQPNTTCLQSNTW